jgi:hypothetical protein
VKASREKRLVGPIFDFARVKYAKLLELSSFFLPHIILGVGKHHDLRKKNTKLLEMFLV